MKLSTAVKTLVTTINIIQTGTGLTLNTCILSFSFKRLKNRPGLNPIHVIYFAMGLVNIVMQLVNTAHNIIFCFWLQVIFMKEFSLTSTVLVLGLMYCNFWLTGWLCVYYCISINNFTHQLIVRLKRIFSSFLPQILLLSTIGSFIISVLSIWMVHVVFLVHTSTNSTQDSSAYAAVLVMPTGYRLISAFLGCCLPFILALISTGVTTFSLMKHIRKMKENNSERSSPNVQALVSATRTMVLFLTFSVIVYLAELFCFSVSRRSSSDALTVVSWIIITLFPSAEGLIIIQATPKLRKMILEMFCARRQSSNVID